MGFIIWLKDGQTPPGKIYLLINLFDEKFVKMWEFYMASCAAAFRYKDLVVFQLQIVKNFQSAHRTRDYIYS